MEEYALPTLPVAQGIPMRRGILLNLVPAPTSGMNAGNLSRNHPTSAS